MGKVDPSVNKSKVFSAPGIVGQKKDISRALRVGKNQIAKANEVAQEMGCGTPFGADGHPEFTRAEKAKYMRELNRRRDDLGEPKLVTCPERLTS